MKYRMEDLTAKVQEILGSEEGMKQLQEMAKMLGLSGGEEPAPQPAPQPDLGAILSGLTGGGQAAPSGEPPISPAGLAKLGSLLQSAKRDTPGAALLRALASFLEQHTVRTIVEDSLKERLRRSKRTLEKYRTYQQKRADRYVPTDLVTPLYCGMTNNILLGTPQVEAYVDGLLKDLESAPAAKGKRIYWMHTIPFWSDAIKEDLLFQESAQIVGCELSEVCEPDFDPEQPYEAMARRMVYHALNGSAVRRIEAGIRHAKQVGADGVVWFDHWGCKHTLGAAQLAKKKFEEAGLPLLILDGDGCDRSHGGEGQTSTRLGAFLEMLNEPGRTGEGAQG